MGPGGPLGAVDRAGAGDPGPDVDEVRRLVEAAGEQASPDKAARDVAILRLLYDLGLRRSEVVGLDLADVDLAGKTLGVVRKGGARVDLELPDETAAALAAWIGRRGAAPGALLVELSPRGERKRLAGNGVYYVVRRLGEGLGLEVRPHGLRHASITAVLAVAAERGLPLPEVLGATGHSRGSLLVLLRYLEEKRRGELARAVAAGLGLAAVRRERKGKGRGGG